MTENKIESQPAAMGGVASRISAAAKAELKSDSVIISATVLITRAATGKIETYQLTGTVPKE